MKKLHFKNHGPVHNANGKEFWEVRNILKASNIPESDQKKITDMIEKISLNLQHAAAALNEFFDAAEKFEMK